MDEQRIYRAALAAWGADAQTLMVFEEMAELQKELCKAARGRDNREQIAEEIADVEIMLALLAFLGSAMRSVFPSATRRFAPVIARNFCPPSCPRIVFATFIFVTPICFLCGSLNCLNYTTVTRKSQRAQG